MSSVPDVTFESTWKQGNVKVHEGPHSLVTWKGTLEGGRPTNDIDGDHVYVVRRVGTSLTTISGRHTDVIYIGQGKKGRANLLWSGNHSLCKKLAWAHAAHAHNPGTPLMVRVEVQRTDSPELREVELLNAFMWEHGQMPALNSRHEGWLPRRVLSAVGKQLLANPVGFEPYGRTVHFTAPRTGPLKLQSPRRVAYTATDLYGDAPHDKHWRWRGSLLWLWPEGWRDDSARAELADLASKSSFVLVGIPDADTDSVISTGWTPVPTAILGHDSWAGASDRLRVQPLGNHVSNLGQPTKGRSEAPSPPFKQLVQALASLCITALPKEGTTG